MLPSVIPQGLSERLLSSENVTCVVCQQLYDRISSKVVSPTRAPPSDAVQKCREVAEVLREFDQNSPELESDLVELEELRDILARPHVRVSNTVCFPDGHLSFRDRNLASCGINICTLC
jgi:hypothetical protein